MNSKVHSILQAINISRDTLKIAWQKCSICYFGKSINYVTRSYGLCFYVGSCICRYWRSNDLYFKLN